MRALDLVDAAADEDTGQKASGEEVKRTGHTCAPWGEWSRCVFAPAYRSKPPGAATWPPGSAPDEEGTQVRAFHMLDATAPVAAASTRNQVASHSTAGTPVSAASVR